MRRLLEEQNYFCQCGHVKRQHEGPEYQYECKTWIYLTGICLCNEFKLDNLRYLEALVDKNG